MSSSCLIIALYPLYDSPAGRLVPDNPRRGTLKTPFVGRSGLSKQTQEVVKIFLSRLGKLKAPLGKRERRLSPKTSSTLSRLGVREWMYVRRVAKPHLLQHLNSKTWRPSGNRAPDLICHNPQQVSILKLRPTWRPSGNRAPAPQISMLRQARAKEKKQNTHTSCVNIEIWGAGAGDPHKFRFENQSLRTESCGKGLIRPFRVL